MNTRKLAHMLDSSGRTNGQTHRQTHTQRDRQTQTDTQTQETRHTTIDKHTNTTQQIQCGPPPLGPKTFTTKNKNREKTRKTVLGFCSCFFFAVFVKLKWPEGRPTTFEYLNFSREIQMFRARPELNIGIREKGLISTKRSPSWEEEEEATYSMIFYPRFNRHGFPPRTPKQPFFTYPRRVHPSDLPAGVQVSLTCSCGSQRCVEFVLSGACPARSEEVSSLEC